MRKDYTILVPNMLPVQLGLMCRLMKNYGYNMELLHTEGPNIAEQGLRNVHNDTCYPALLVIGQLLDAIESGKYDIHKVALKMCIRDRVRIAAADAAHRLEVAAVHADQKVVGLVVRRLQQAGGFSVTSYPVLGQLAARWRVDGIAELLRTHSSGSDLRAAGQAGALQQVVHYELCLLYTSASCSRNRQRPYTP